MSDLYDMRQIGHGLNIRANTAIEDATMTPAKSPALVHALRQGHRAPDGRPGTFACAVLVIGLGVTGPVFHWSDTWQLVINTGTTIITFLMVFLIQSTQNRDSEAIQVKLDELLRISAGHNALLDLEELEEDELERIRAVYTRLAEEAASRREVGLSDEGVPEIGELAGRTTPSSESCDS